MRSDSVCFEFLFLILPSNFIRCGHEFSKYVIDATNGIANEALSKAECDTSFVRG